MGTRIGAFELGEEIGAGGMGRVYRARDARLGRDVAIKVLADELRGDPERVRRFETEARAVAKLTHPNVMAIHDVGTDGDAPYLVCELLDGESLRDRLRAGPMPWRKAVELAIQIAAGLAAAHAAGIVHRDLKPANVFVTRDGRAKLLDFGVARVGKPELPAGDSTVTGAVIGTAGYMAPEQVRGEPADARADIFALGAVLYELLAGRKAFEGSTDVERAYAVLKSEPAELANVPSPVSRVVRRCLEKRADERFESARDVGFALEALLDASVTRGDATPARERRWRIPALVGATAIAAGAAGWLAHRGGREAPRAPPTFDSLTFQRGVVREAKFAAALGGVVYTAAWDSEPATTYLAIPGHTEARALFAPGAELMAVSPSGEVALRIQPDDRLARASIAGGEPRITAEHVLAVDWIPNTDELAIVRQDGRRFFLEFPAGHPVLENDYLMAPIRVSRDGSRVAVAVGDNAMWDLVVVDRVGGKTVLADDWVDINGVEWSPDGREVWFSGAGISSSRNRSAIVASDLAGNVRELAGGPAQYRLHDVGADGRCLVTREISTRRVAVRRAGEAGERDLSIYDRPANKALTADGKTMLILERGSAAPKDIGGAIAFLRGTDGSPPVKLMDGFAETLSPDGSLAIGFTGSRDPEQLIVVPVGPGPRRELPRGPLVEIRGVAFFPDGKRIAVAGIEDRRTREPRIYVQDLAGGAPRPVTPVGTSFDETTQPVSQDGQSIVATDSIAPYRIYPLAGGAPREIPGIQRADIPIQWGLDGRLFVLRPGPGRATIHAVDLGTGTWTQLADIAPPDRAGTNLGRDIDGDTFPRVGVTPDGKTFGYRYFQTLSQLYLVTGLR